MTTIKVAPNGGVVWRFDSAFSHNIGHLNGDRYFAMGTNYAGGYQNGRFTVLDLSGNIVLDDTALASTTAVDCSGGAFSVGSAALQSGGVAFFSGSASVGRLSFFDADGVLTGVSNSTGDSDIAAVGDSVCMRSGGNSTSPGYKWIASDGTTTGSELRLAGGGDTIFGGNIVSFGSQVLLCGLFDVNANGTYQSATDHRYRLYGDSGPPEASGAITATGDTIWATRYGSNSYALCVPQTAITKITSGLTVTRNTISGVGETTDLWRDVKEDSNGTVNILSNSTLYNYSQSGGAANWTVSLTNYRRLACDASGNIYVCGTDLKKYNSAGSLQWTTDVPNIAFAGHIPTDEVGIHRNTSLHVDDDGFIYVTGARQA